MSTLESPERCEDVGARHALLARQGWDALETFGAALALLEEQFFTGRVLEIQLFLGWISLTTSLPSILNVTGPGGVGKTTLLRAFSRLARERARPVILIDGHGLESTPTAFLSALSTAPIDPAPTVRRPPIASTDEVVEYLNATRPLLLIDTFEELAPLGRYLREELLPRLALDVRVVIAGRYPLARAWGDAWARLLRPISLSAFSRDDGRLYLERRGIAAPTLVRRILEATAGHPLALSLAADLALQPGSRDFVNDPSWKLAAHGVVEQLLRDVADNDLRNALEAASVVRQFDEATLAALTGRPLEPGTFSRLCALSFVRASEHGLMLHDDIRRILSNDVGSPGTELEFAL